MEIERGIQKSIKYAIVGFLIPVFSVGVYWIVYSMFYDIHPIDRENDLARLPLLILVPSTGLAGISACPGMLLSRRSEVFLSSDHSLLLRV